MLSLHFLARHGRGSPENKDLRRASGLVTPNMGYQRAEAMIPTHRELDTITASGIKPAVWHQGDKPLS